MGFHQEYGGLSLSAGQDKYSGVEVARSKNEQLSDERELYVVMGRRTRYTHGESRLIRTKRLAFRQDAIIFWQPLESNYADWNDGSSRPVEGITKLHNNGTSVGVVDGHVEFMKTVNFYNEANIATRNRLWCNPGKDNDGRY